GCGIHPIIVSKITPKLETPHPTVTDLTKSY
ncbi:hypothetical protein DEU38_13922, partial [Rhodococcus sp. AG1013]